MVCRTALVLAIVIITRTAVDRACNEAKQVVVTVVLDTTPPGPDTLKSIVAGYQGSPGDGRGQRKTGCTGSGICEQHCPGGGQGRSKGRFPVQNKPG